MKIIFFCFLILFSLIECKIKVTDFCNKIEIKGNKIECNGDHGLSCGINTCSRDLFSCQSLKLISGVKNFEGFGQNYNHLKRVHDLFKSKIKNCTNPKYEWNPNDVCLNIKISFRKDNLLGFKVNRMKPDECTEKYNIKCNKYYCASDKRACNHYEFKMARNNSNIKICKQTIEFTKYFRFRF
jgi:hypothetical protein